MLNAPPGSCLVAFVSIRGDAVWDGEYARHVATLDELIQDQPGYLDMTSVRDPVTRHGITIAVFVDEASARAWKGVAEHRLAQEFGRQRGYADYHVVITLVQRSYGHVGEGP